MALLNRVKCALASATAANATTFVVGAAASGYQLPGAAGAQSGTNYSIVIEEGAAWFAFIGTWQPGGPQFVVAQAIASSTGGAAPAFTTAASLYCTPLVQDLPSGKAAGSDLRTGTDDLKFVTSKSLLDAAGVVTLTDAATITPDFAAGINFKVTLGGNRTLGFPSNPRSGQSGVIIVSQDGVGGRTLAFSGYRFPSGAPNLSPSPNAVDMITYFALDASTIACSILKSFA